MREIIQSTNNILVNHQVFHFADDAILQHRGKGLVQLPVKVKEGRGLIFEGGLFSGKCNKTLNTNATIK